MICEKTQQFCTLCEDSARKGTLKNIVLASPKDGDTKKVKCTQKTVGKKNCIQIESFCTEGRVRQENVKSEELSDKIAAIIGAFSRAELNDSGGSASLLVSKKGKVTVITHGSIGSGEKVNAAEKEKNYILSGKEAFLYHLGISDENGRVHDKRQAKYRQINRFLEHVSDAVSRLPKDGTIYISDLCCGKSYLSFAVYYYLTVVLGRDSVMDCVDLKASVMEQCAEIAEKCGFSGMNFTAGDVSRYTSSNKPHIVISLHACDTATDIVLERAVALGAEIILATPCCHRQLSRQLNCPELSFISKNSILKSKFCDAATDALRVLRLEACGYSADAVELIDPDDTPKNVLIRAYKSHKISYKDHLLQKKTDEYNAAYRFLTGSDAPEIITYKGSDNLK